MKTVLLLHDAFANPTDYWYESIKSIIPSDYQLITPELSAGSMQGYSYWIKVMEQYKDTINGDTIFITHGISSLLLFKILEQVQTPVRSSIIIAGTGESPAHKVYAPIADTFLETPLDWKMLQTKTKTIFHIYNAQDPFVNPQLSKQLSELLPGKGFPLSGSEHFYESAEPELIQVLQTIFQKFEQEDKDQHLAAIVNQETQQKKAVAESTVPGMVTYDGDVAASVAGYQGAVISELLSEARHKEKIEKEKSPTNIKNIAYIIGTLLLVAVGLGLFFYASMNTKSQRVPARVEKKQFTNTLMNTETIDLLDITNDQRFVLLGQLKELQGKEIPAKTFQSIVPIASEQPTNFEMFAQKLELKFPLGFAGKTENFIYGFYQGSDQGKIPFLLVRFDGYDTIHSIMSTWEPDMINGTLQLFSKDYSADTLLKPESAEFTDSIVNNLPVRSGKNNADQVVSYAFLNDKTLLITPNPIVADPILRRIIGR